MARTTTRCAVSLRDLFPRAQFTQPGDLRIDKCSADWRDCAPGDLFIAQTTADGDGHDEAEKAVARGAIGVLGERLLPLAAPQVLVRDTRQAHGQLVQALAGNPSRQMRTIGVGGTAGKTVTAMLLAAIFEQAGENVGVLSSIGYSDSLVQTAPREAAPSTDQFADWLGRMHTAGCQTAVVELSTRVLAERRAAGIELDAAILTNIRRDPHAQHATPHGCLRAHRRLFSLLKPGGVAILSADDHRSRNLLPKLKSPALSFGLHAAADLSAEVLERHRSEQTFLLCAGEETAVVRTRMIGDHHVANCLAATAVGLAAGVELAKIVRGLESIEHVPGRLERLECGQDFGVFVDAAASPESLALSMQAVRRVTAGRLIVVAGAPAGGDKAIRPLLGRVLERGAHLPILTSSGLGGGRSDRPGREAPLAIAHDLLDGFDRPQRAHVIPSRAAAIQFALGEARPGDSVLITGPGNLHAPLAGQEIAGQQRACQDDREIACQWLYERGEAELGRPKLRIFR
jgi:UDP-N-acetylmuramoyl-L-alanyl-D-glutamate--2,6-diaminopimelate ligase